MDALYEYTVDGNLYKGNRVSPWVMVATHNAKVVLEKQLRKVERSRDGSVSVFYNPANPKKSLLIKPGVFGLKVTALIAVGAPTLYITSYHT